MAVTEIHSIYAVSLGVGSGSNLLGGIQNVSMPTGTDVRGEPTSGVIYTDFNSIVAQKPSVQFSSLHVASMLDQIALAGLDIGGLSGGLSLYGYAHIAGGGRAGASAHRKLTVNDGLAFPMNISAEHQGDAVMQAGAAVIYDGSNAPIVIADGESVPTAPVDDERFTIGPVTIGGKLLVGVMSLQIEFGVQVVPVSADSDVHDTFASIVTVLPVITISGIDLAWFKSSNIPLAGLAAAHANTSIYLRKRAEGGTFVADGVAEHIKFTADGLAVIDSAMEGSGQDPSTCSLTLRCRFDATNAPLVIVTTSAIT